jgi:ketosteroid isomerase-like protein
MTTTQQTTVERLLEDWATTLSARDVDGFLLLFSDDVVYEDVTFGVVNHG